MDKEKMVKIDSDKLKMVMAEKKMSQRKLSEEIGRTHTYISLVLANGEMSEVNEKFVCLILGETPGYFIRKEEPKVEKKVKPADNLEVLRALDIVNKNVIKLQKTVESIAEDVEVIRNKVAAHTIKLAKISEKLDSIVENDIDKAVRFLKDELAMGRQNVDGIRYRASTAKISEADLHRAKGILNVQTDVTGMGRNQKTFWYLP